MDATAHGHREGRLLRSDAGGHDWLWPNVCRHGGSERDEDPVGAKQIEGGWGPGDKVQSAAKGKLGDTSVLLRTSPQRPGVHIPLLPPPRLSSPFVGYPAYPLPPRRTLLLPCPTLLRLAPTESPSPPPLPPPGRRRRPERPSRKAPSALSRAATPVGSAGRYVDPRRVDRRALRELDAHRSLFFAFFHPCATSPRDIQKCDEQPNEHGACQTCVRLRLQCLGFGAKRPDWMRVSAQRGCYPPRSHPY